jgi:hypothetical protein
MKLLKFILENAQVHVVQQAVKEFNIPGIGYKMRMSIINEFPEYNGRALQFGIDLSNELEAFKVDMIELSRINTEINAIHYKLSTYGKYHPTYKTLTVEHDILVELNNKLGEPITKFLELYKKAQKEKGKKISVVKKKERSFQSPQ